MNPAEKTLTLEAYNELLMINVPANYHVKQLRDDVGQRLSVTSSILSLTYNGVELGDDDDVISLSAVIHVDIRRKQGFMDSSTTLDDKEQMIDPHDDAVNSSSHDKITVMAAQADASKSSAIHNETSRLVSAPLTEIGERASTIQVEAYHVVSRVQTGADDPASKKNASVIDSGTDHTAFTNQSDAATKNSTIQHDINMFSIKTDIQPPPTKDGTTLPVVNNESTKTSLIQNGSSLNKPIFENNKSHISAASKDDHHEELTSALVDVGVGVELPIPDNDVFTFNAVIIKPSTVAAEDDSGIGSTAEGLKSVSKPVSAESSSMVLDKSEIDLTEVKSKSSTSLTSGPAQGDLKQPIPEQPETPEAVIERTERVFLALAALEETLYQAREEMKILGVDLEIIETQEHLAYLGLHGVLLKAREKAEQSGIDPDPIQERIRLKLRKNGMEAIILRKIDKFIIREGFLGYIDEVDKWTDEAWLSTQLPREKLWKATETPRKEFWKLADKAKIQMGVYKDMAVDAARPHAQDVLHRFRAKREEVIQNCEEKVPGAKDAFIISKIIFGMFYNIMKKWVMPNLTTYVTEYGQIIKDFILGPDVNIRYDRSGTNLDIPVLLLKEQVDEPKPDPQPLVFSLYYFLKDLFFRLKEAHPKEWYTLLKSSVAELKLDEHIGEMIQASPTFREILETLQDNPQVITMLMGANPMMFFNPETMEKIAEKYPIFLEHIRNPANQDELQHDPKALIELLAKLAGPPPKGFMKKKDREAAELAAAAEAGSDNGKKKKKKKKKKKGEEVDLDALQSESRKKNSDSDVKDSQKKNSDSDVKDKSEDKGKEKPPESEVKDKAKVKGKSERKSKEENTHALAKTGVKDKEESQQVVAKAGVNGLSTDSAQSNAGPSSVITEVEQKRSRVPIQSTFYQQNGPTYDDVVIPPDYVNESAVSQSPKPKELSKIHTAEIHTLPADEDDLSQRSVTPEMSRGEDVVILNQQGSKMPDMHASDEHLPSLASSSSSIAHESGTSDKDKGH